MTLMTSSKSVALSNNSARLKALPSAELELFMKSPSPTPIAEKSKISNLLSPLISYANSYNSPLFSDNKPLISSCVMSL